MKSMIGKDADLGHKCLLGEESDTFLTTVRSQNNCGPLSHGRRCLCTQTGPNFLNISHCWGNAFREYCSKVTQFNDEGMCVDLLINKPHTPIVLLWNYIQPGTGAEVFYFLAYNVLLCNAFDTGSIVPCVVMKKELSVHSYKCSWMDKGEGYHFGGSFG